MDRQDRARLRCLAQRYAEYAHGRPMAARREKWRLHNRLEERTFPFHIEDNGTYLRDLMPPLACTEPACRELEARLLHAVVSYERIDDDRIIPARFVVDWSTPVDSFCPELRFRHVDDGYGGSFGYESNRPVRDLEADFHKLRRRTATLDRAGTERRVEVAEEAFAGLLPVVVGRVGSYYSDGIMNKAVHALGMEELYLAMATRPEAVHRLFAFLAADNVALGQWEEEQGLLTRNNDGNQGYCSGSSQFTDEMPMPQPDDAPVRSRDRYGYLETQEAVGLSPAMFDEFLMPYLSGLAARFRLMKFGCCEPVHHLMPLLCRLHGLRKVSVTPWCDLRRLAAQCPPDIIWSRKPVPLKLCGDRFDPAELRAHLQETLEIGAGYFVEFVFRDTNRLTGAMQDRVAAACAMVRALTGHPEGSRENGTGV